MRCVASSAATQRLYFVAVQMLSVLQRCRKPVHNCADSVFAVPPPPSAESAPGGECRAKRVVRQAVSVAAPRQRALVATRVETRRAMQQPRPPDVACGKGERNSVSSEASGLINCLAPSRQLPPRQLRAPGPPS